MADKISMFYIKVFCLIILAFVVVEAAVLPSSEEYVQKSVHSRQKRTLGRSLKLHLKLE